MQRRRLSSELRRLRDASGYTLEEAAKKSGIARSRLGRIETSDLKTVKTADLDALLDLYEVTETGTREAMHGLARDAGERGWWSRYRDVFGTRALPDFEAEAAAIRTFTCQVVPGLLQIPEYADALVRGTGAFADDEIRRRVDARMERQQILTRFYPPDYSAVVDEAALRRQPSDPAIMREQVTHLDHMATRSNIQLYVLPFAAGLHAATLGSFVIMDFPDPLDPSIGFSETPTDTLFVEDEAEIQRYNAMWYEVVNAALTPAQSRDFLRDLLASLEREQ
ncbi:helix-turn-helix transcriptional regulator [Nocardiopsis sp. RSe5-2]|uniref:Helix-turn-helix transcriptional regulator n=1 Tax=Nocardiopsis endophytica TaxID=3018445 RepID=A0ABT4U6E4_9ACTN|nr:helix-turn-helix transcriptional regulator [Nocardiopsis endophytica]MDA2812518.1 helix-turn-helix transcriptional regulator [Nocardiopsis endophytica]